MDDPSPATPLLRHRAFVRFLYVRIAASIAPTAMSRSGRQRETAALTAAACGIILASQSAI